MWSLRPRVVHEKCHIGMKWWPGLEPTLVLETSSIILYCHSLVNWVSNLLHETWRFLHLEWPFSFPYYTKENWGLEWICPSPKTSSSSHETSRLRRPLRLPFFLSSSSRFFLKPFSNLRQDQRLGDQDFFPVSHVYGHKQMSFMRLHKLQKASLIARTSSICFHVSVPNSSWLKAAQKN